MFKKIKFIAHVSMIFVELMFIDYNKDKRSQLQVHHLSVRLKVEIKRPVGRAVLK